jgi:murein DD-endopeptidase MepM/ murein hydrolase activator NlpD
MRNYFNRKFLMELLSKVKMLERKKFILFLTTAAIIVVVVAGTTVLFAGSTEDAYEVMLDDKYIATVETTDIIDNMVKDILKRTEQKYGAEAVLMNKLTFNKVALKDISKLENSTLKDLLGDSAKLNLKAYAINVDGKDIACFKDKASAEKVLDKVKEPYINKDENKSENVKEIGFVEDVNIVEKNVPLKELDNPEEVYEAIIEPGSELRTYTVEAGDTVSEIAEELGVRVADIEKANPDLNVDHISIGQVLNLVVPRYGLNVQKIIYQTVIESIPYEIVYEETEDLYRGDTKTKIQGLEGKSLVKQELVVVNGVLEETNVYSESVLQVPKPGVLLKGTKQRPRTVATGSFAVPTRGRYSSSFGERWGRQHNGVDIAVPRGTPITASDGGIVKFAGWMSGYGNLVIIDHENGFNTYYGHQDRMNVKKGKRVAKGDIIGYVGSTGRSTGPHLHFEVRKNGIPVNPMNYIK